MAKKAYDNGQVKVVEVGQFLHDYSALVREKDAAKHQAAEGAAKAEHQVRAAKDSLAKTKGH